MKAGPIAAHPAAMISDPSRAAMLTAMMDGRFHPASELAYMAGITPQTASYHLAKLEEAGMVAMHKQGRHRYYGLKSHDVATVVETLLLLAPPVEIKSLRQSEENRHLRRARTCYDHVAGDLGIRLRDAMIEAGVIREEADAFAITGEGAAFFEHMGIDVEAVRKKRRSFCSKCLDWSERTPHLAGSLGSALLERLLELRWLLRMEGTRALRITDEGVRGLQETFHIEIPRS
uniref:ArsR/SmtB family transcription factor n=1 Tax=Paenibacillus terrae TaxID=159743 RepID=UPI0011A37862|nr:winged helix-turn-helix domain-containing protein [Paenibacillus terrae]